VTHPIGDDAALPDPAAGPVRGVVGSDGRRDPATGAGITLFGIFLMGTGGATDAHYLFDAGAATAVIGAMIYVLFVALTALKMRRGTPAPATGAAPSGDSAPPAELP
jgi:hypothetical protein